MTPATVAEVVRLTARMAADRLAGKRIVIVFVEEPGFVQFLLPVHAELMRLAGDRMRTYLATEYADGVANLASFDVPEARRFHPRLARAMFLADVFLSASVYGRGPRSAHRINISHNQPTKFETYPREHVVNYDVHFLTGPLHREQYEHMFRLHGLATDKYQLLDIGYPKSDALHQGRFERSSVLEGLGLDANRRTILYAPAWDPGGSLRSFGGEVIEQLLAVENANVIVKLHPVSHTPASSPSYEFYTGGVNWVERFRQYESNERFRHVAEFQVDPLLVAADVLVTDFSSVALEFVGLDKPIIYIDCPEYFEKTLRLPGYETDPDYVKNNPRANAGRHVGLVAERVSDLRTIVERALADPARGSEKRRELATRLLYNPGRGANTAARQILSLLGLQ